MSEKNVILYVGGFELPDKNAAAHRVSANAKIFKSLGYEPAFLGYDKSLETGVDVLSTRTQYFNFDSWAQPYPSGKLAWFKQTVSTANIKALVNGPLAGRVHSIICYNYPAISQIRLQGFCRRRGIHLVADSTEWYSQYGKKSIHAAVKDFDTALRMNYVNKKVDGLILTSPYLEEYYKASCKTTVVLPTLYDLDSRVERPTLIKGLPDNTPVKFLYAGSPFVLNLLNEDRSNVKDRTDTVIDIFSHLLPTHNNFQLDLIGLTKDNFLLAFPEFKSKLEALGDRVIFHGRQPHGTVIDMLQSANFSIFIRHLNRTIEAGFPSKFSESMTFGTPVISNIYSSVSEFVDEGNNHYALPLGDLNGQVEKMKTILSQPKTEHERMKKFCHDNAIFDYRAFSAVTSEFLKKLDAQKAR